MVRANQRAKSPFTSFTAYRETRLHEKSVTVQDAAKVFSWQNTRTGIHAVNVDLLSLCIRNIQNKKGNKKRGREHIKVNHLTNLPIPSLIVSAIDELKLVYNVSR